MTARGLIIAIQRYDASNEPSIGQELPNTIKGATAFRDWLRTHKKVDARNIIFCAEPGVEGRTGGTTRGEIVDALKQLSATGADATSELYVYFSGHGFSYLDNPFGAPLDVLVMSDFVALDESGGTCVRLREIQEKLWRTLGPGDHFYFVDACRNPIASSAIEVTALGTSLGPASQLGTPAVYTLYSTALGMTAHVESEFANHLVKGLSGAGRAKGWLRSEMWVTFELLCDYVKAHVRGQEADAEKKGSRRGTILQLDPVPESICRVSVEGAKPGAQFTLTIRDVQGLEQQREVRGGASEIRLKPHDYYFELREGGAPLPQVAPSATEPVDLYEPGEVRFRAEPKFRDVRTPPPDMTLPTAHVKIAGAPDANIELRHVQSGLRLDGRGSLNESVPPGVYDAKVREHGITVRKTRIELRAGSSRTIDLVTGPPPSRAHAAIVSALGQDPGSPPDFSEMLGGPVVRPDLSLWLSLIGASRILGVPDAFSKLEKLELARFDDAAPDEAHLLLLAASERPLDGLRAAVSEGRLVAWQPVRRIPQLVDVFELALPVPAGHRLLSFHVQGMTPMTVPIVSMANRVTLVTLVLDPTGRGTLHQFLLPLHHQLHNMPNKVRRRIERNPLTAVRTMWIAQHLFARQRELEPALRQDDARDWIELTYSKWLDPILSVIAAYELVRRGRARDDRPMFKIIIRNLRLYFGALPDTEALARLAGLPWETPVGPPLLLDGLLALEDELHNRLPLPITQLDYAGPWTMWHNAVGEAL